MVTCLHASARETKRNETKWNKTATTTPHHGGGKRDKVYIACLNASARKTKRNETTQCETKQNEIKRNQTKRNEAKRNETKSDQTKRNKTKRNETKRKVTHHTVMACHHSTMSAVSVCTCVFLCTRVYAHMFCLCMCASYVHTVFDCSCAWAQYEILCTRVCVFLLCSH